MKNLMRYLSASLLASMFLIGSPIQAATSKKKPASSQTKAKPSASSKEKTTSTKVRSSSSGMRCTTQKLKGGVTRKVCKGSSVEPLLSSPIQGNALNSTTPAEKSPEVKARSAPERAYAVDGESFFYQGRRYRVAGLEGAGSSDMAKQSLQKSLESGALAIDPLETDASGVSTAVVRINGRNLAEKLR